MLTPRQTVRALASGRPFTILTRSRSIDHTKEVHMTHPTGEPPGFIQRPACFNPILKIAFTAPAQRPTPSAVKHDDHSIRTAQASRTRRTHLTMHPAGSTSPTIPNSRNRAPDRQPKPPVKHPDPQPDRVSLHDVKISGRCRSKEPASGPLPLKVSKQRQTVMRLDPEGEAPRHADVSGA